MSYQGLLLDGNGYASIADGSQAGLNMGLSDFMLEIRVKLLVPLASQPEAYPRVVDKWIPSYIGYSVYFRRSDEELGFIVDDGTLRADMKTNANQIDDLQWHYLVVILDRSSATGMKFYIDGNEVGSYTQQDSPTSLGNIDSANSFGVGASGYGTNALFDELRVWNFGYGGLPADYEAYITWRAAGRNVFKDISEYSGGIWNGYADADRTELLTYGALDDDNSDFEGAGPDGTDVSTNTNWFKVSTSCEIDDEAGSGVTTYNGSTFCAKIHTATDDYPKIILHGPLLDAVFTLGEWYEISYDYKVANVTAAWMRVRNDAGLLATKALTSAVWTTDRFIFQVVTDTNMQINPYSHLGTDEDSTEVVWIDNVSIKKIGKVAHYKFENNLLDEGSNNNDLTTGGTGNLFPTYSLKREKIIVVGAVNPAMGDRR